MYKRQKFYVQSIYNNLYNACIENQHNRCDDCTILPPMSNDRLCTK